MNIVVTRFTSDSDTTISQVKIDGEFECFGLEDEYRAEKVVGETRIPAGTYPVQLRAEGGHHQRYQRRFGDLHRGMLHIQDVPGFTYILIHCGNTDADTAGCLLVGTGACTEPENMSITSSRTAYRRLYQDVVDAAKRHNLQITFIDSDREF